MTSFLKAVGVFLKTIGRGCGMVAAGIVFILVAGLAIALIVFVVRYETWASKNESEVERIAITEIESRDALEYQMEKRLTDFQKSKVQRESMALSCDMLGILMENVLEESWRIENEDVGLVCGNRSMTLSVKMWDLWWVNVKVWQRAEGAVEFVVYDVNIGPFSLAGVTFGYLSEQLSNGVGDALELVSSDAYSGRKIEKMYIDEDGMRIVGVLEDEEE